MFGDIHFSPDYDNLAILIYEKTGETSSGWSSEDGLVISAPAKNRYEALKVTNGIMRKWYDRDDFKEFE